MLPQVCVLPAMYIYYMRVRMSYAHTHSYVPGMPGQRSYTCHWLRNVTCYISGATTDAAILLATNLLILM